MEKLVFVFRRKEGLSRDAFHAHYRDHHAPLGLRLAQGLSGYTVNHLITEAGFDTITEIWTPSARDFAGGGRQPSPEIVADHMSFMGPQDAYVVEERIVRDGPLDPPLGRPGTRRKVITIHAANDALPDVAPGAVRVVDNVVLKPIYLRDRPVPAEDVPGDGVVLIRMSWFDAEPDDARGGVEVREYRYRAVETA